MTHKKSVFLEKEYLRLIEKSEHTRLSCRYVIVYRGQQVAGIIYFQVVDFKAGVFGNLLTRQLDNIRDRRLNLFERYIDSNREEVLLRLFTCGNNLISGRYGFIFDKSMKDAMAHEILLSITDLVAREEKLRGTISAILLKDFEEKLKPQSLFTDEKYSDFLVEPNMIVDLPPQVRSLEDYTSLFSKKYRNRAKSIFKSLEGITVKYLDAEEIYEQEGVIYSLYDEIFSKAKFRLMKLPRHYFSDVKKLFGDVFIFKVFILDNEIIGFASGFKMADRCFEAHYIGFRYALNNEYNIYQNILYTMIDEGIKNNCRCVNLGRTASEIKTTVGARPHDLVCYIKPQNTISRLIQRPFISFLQPAEWTPRNPFREEKTPA